MWINKLVQGIPLLVVVGLTTDSADTVSYGLNECLNPLIWGYFSNLAIIQQACDGSRAVPAQPGELSSRCGRAARQRPSR
jgi:hypothetical protein